MIKIAAAILSGRRRSFRQDARQCLTGLEPKLAVVGSGHIPAAGPCLVVTNHFSQARGIDENGKTVEAIGAWWLALAISAQIPTEMHWVMTGAWTYPDWLRSHTLTPFSTWLFQHLAAVYGFTSMPPMPPRLGEVEARARSVRQVVAYVRRTPQAWVGLAPEGRDIPGGALGEPPAGVGRFIELITTQKVAPGSGTEAMPVLPAGMFVQGGGLHLRFGPPFVLDYERKLPAHQRDERISGQVMRAIASCLPLAMRGSIQAPSNQAR